MSVPVSAAICGAALSVGFGGLFAVGLLVAGAQAANAADAAALAAADAQYSTVLGTADDPCDLAEQVARASGAELAQCELSDAPGEARVRTTIRVGLIIVTRSARAGPPAS